MMLNFFKNRIFQILTLILLLVIIFIIEPKLDCYYLSDKAEYISRPYYYLTFLILSLTLIGFWFFRKKLREFKTNQIFGFIITVAIFSIFYQIITKDIILSINLLADKNTIEKEYRIVKYKPNKILLFNTSLNEVIRDSLIISRIDSKRIINKQISLFKLNDNDTLKVEFTKGLFGLEYLKK